MILLALHIKEIAHDSVTEELIIGYIMIESNSVVEAISNYTGLRILDPSESSCILEQIEGLVLGRYYTREEAFNKGLDVIGVDEYDALTNQENLNG